MLKYLYTGSIHLEDAEMCVGLLYLANYYDLAQLKVHLERRLAATVWMDNFIPLLQLTDTIPLPLLRRACKSFFLKHKLEITGKTEWKALKGGSREGARVVADFLEWTFCSAEAVAAEKKQTDSPTSSLNVVKVSLERSGERASHVDSCLADFGGRPNTGLCTDCLIKAGGLQFRAHRTVLSQRSPVFKELFSDQERQVVSIQVDWVDAVSQTTLLK